MNTFCVKPGDIREIRNSLLRWFDQNGRKFPWRESTDPYRILVAEIMLHRTRAEQVLPVYTEFIGRFPDPFSLYKADERELVSLLSGLGLHWRVRLFMQLRRELVERFGGRVPCRREDLRSLPGVSDYICSMVRCLAFGCPDPLLDTNTVRLSGRFFSLRVTDSSRRSRLFRTAVSLLMDPDRPDRSALALVDAGSIVCRPREPLCARCPLSAWCSWYRNSRAELSMK